MAITYIGASGLFTAVGKLIEHSNKLLVTTGGTLDADVLDILDTFEAQDITTPVDNVPNFYDQIEQSIIGARGQLAQSVELRLQDQDSVIDELGLATLGVDSIMAALITRMNVDGETVNASSVAISWPADINGDNIGTGLVVISTKMDGITQPANGSAAQLAYDGLDCQLQISETVFMNCTRDAGDGVTAGSETFQVSGRIQSRQWSFEAEGSGTGISVSTANAAGILNGGNFESWTSDTPTGWTIDNGSASTHVLEETGNVFQGTGSAKILGDGALPAVIFSQSTTSVNARRRYLVTCAVRRVSTMTAGTFRLFFSGTGYTETSSTTEVQRVQISGTPTGGTYPITWRGQTIDVAYDATSATLQTALRTMKGLEGVVVATHAGAAPNITHNITMHGVYDPEVIVSSAGDLTGGTPAVTVSTPTPFVAGDCLEIDYTGIPTDWGVRWFFITMPDAIPSDWKLNVSLADTPANGEGVYLDNVFIDPLHWHNGVAFNILSGATAFRRGDVFQSTITNTEGVFQKFFRQWRGVQLPSNASGAETIPDSLAT